MNDWTSIPGVSRVYYRPYRIPNGVEANCVAVDLGGRWMVVSPAYEMPEAAFAQLVERGPVAALVAPNSGHDFGQAPWQARFPDAVSFAPEAALPRLAKAWPKLRPFRPLSALGDLPAGIVLRDAPGTRSGATLVSVEDADGRFVYTDELITNMAELQGPAPFRFLFWVTGSAPGVRVNKVFRTLFCSDAGALTGAVREVLATPTTALPAHGRPLDGGAMLQALGSRPG